MPDIESPAPSVTEGEIAAPESESSATDGAGEAVQAGEPVGSQAAEQAEGQQAQAETVQEEYEDAPVESKGTKYLREFGERWQTKAKTYETALTSLGGLEGLQELAEPLQALLNPMADSVNVLEAVTRIAPHLDSTEFVGTALDAMPDEAAARLLSERQDDAAKILFGDILGADVTAQSIRDILTLYKPDEQEIPEHVQRQLAEAQRIAREASDKTSKFEQEQERLREQESTRQLQAAHLSLGKRMWETPTEHVIGKLKLTELPPDAPESVKADFSRAQDVVRTQAQLATMNDPQAQNLLRLVEGQVAAAMKAPESQRQALMQRAERTAAAIANIQQAKAVEFGTFIKGLLDDRLALRASEAETARNQRAEVVGAGGGGVAKAAGSYALDSPEAAQAIKNILASYR